MELGEFSNKNIEIISISGLKIRGKAYDHTSALDNPEGEESISIDSIEIFKTEIESIRLI